ncbi:hypothetical protein OAF98_00585 [Planctomicrobium sp.]|jgi:hypothetical protein|nr:tetratricopeptide repeat protein [Planctomicrobium sp.]MBT5020293.1 hypothetical protein [Planctomicrobium sp.]MDB4742954.1 hypothetical protein [Planctomicrobium sp.]
MRPNHILIAFGLAAILTGSVFAQQIDTVYLKNSEKFGGEITEVTKTDVTVTQKVGNKVEKIPANTIYYIEWKGEPPQLSLARSNERSGNFADAVTGYQEALAALEGSNPRIKDDIDFMLARTGAKIAIADPSQAASAIKNLSDYVASHRDYYRFFDAQLMLAETALKASDTTTADSAFSALQQAPWSDYQLAGKIGSANTLLARDDINAAKSIFDSVAGTSPKTPAEKSRQLEGKLGQAECLQRQNNQDEAAKILDAVVDESTSDDTRILAQAYVKMGDGFAAQGQKNKEAILAYLHVDVIPSLAAHSDLHAEALFRLTKLWSAVGQPTRSADAAAKLESDYPNSPWTKQLGAAS